MRYNFRLWYNRTNIERGGSIMEFKHLEYFIEASQHKSMSRAAEALYISQQALSRCIANMEQELGVELFTAR